MIPPLDKVPTNPWEKLAKVATAAVAPEFKLLTLHSLSGLRSGLTIFNDKGSQGANGCVRIKNG
jgi:hypothetical protein